MNELTLLSTATIREDELHLIKFAEWMGIRVSTVEIGTQTSCEVLREPVGQGKNYFAMSADTLVQIQADLKQSAGLLNLIAENCSVLLIFNCNDSKRHNPALAQLFNSNCYRVTSSPDGPSVFTLPQTARSFSRQLAGQKFVSARTASIPVFEHVQDTGDLNSDVILSRESQPIFIHVETRRVRVFLLAGQNILDISSLATEKELPHTYDRLIPILIFFRSVFGKACWHGPLSTARLIIDDPLLWLRYGGLDYATLRETTDRRKFGTSIAFIPWNHWRTSRRLAERLLHETNLSICVHGCDHTNKEFDGSDAALLSQKARLALRRLEAHEKRTGVEFDPVMVFPQGIFSDAAMAALRDNNYLAAVNSDCSPTDREFKGLSIGDLLRPAITRFHGFPLFQRRYPHELIELALDLFLGRPALIVEHHEYFQDGCAKLDKFLGEMQLIEPNLQWPSLASQLMQSCMMRRSSEDHFEVEFYTHKFRLMNSANSRLRFSLRKFETEVSTIKAVLVDGISTAFSFKASHIVLEIPLEAGQASTVEIEYNREVDPVESSGLRHNAGVMLRRYLSEFRDNTLVRYPRLLRMAKNTVRRLNVAAKG